MKKIILSILFLLINICINAQDVFITVTGKYFATNEAMSLDAIKIQNYSNGTNIVLENLPNDITDYEINLSRLVSIPNFDLEKEKIILHSNSPNITQILVSLAKNQTVNFEVFDLSGKLKYSSNFECEMGDNIIDVLTNCFSIIRISTSNLISSFKSVGINLEKQISIKQSSFKYKVVQKTKAVNFRYQEGDSLKITAIKSGYHDNFLASIPQNGDIYNIYLNIPCPGAETVTDFDGNVYTTVQIGTQCWMKENLKTTHYADGTALVDGTGVGYIWGDYNKYWFNYNDDPAIAEIYGKLYTWTAIMNGSNQSNNIPSGVQGICPNGWHVPSYAEYNNVLLAFLGNDAGSKLKENGYEHWNYPNKGGNNKSGFTALPSGLRDYTSIESIFILLGKGCNLWITYSYKSIYWLDLWYDYDFAYMGGTSGENVPWSGAGIRCTKD